MQRVTRDQFCSSYSADNAPALTVEPGETFIMETEDRFATYEGPGSPPAGLEVLKHMAGPVYVEGARPGDTLRVEVLEVALPFTHGWIGATPGRGPIGDRIPQFRKAKVSITGEGAVFRDGTIIPMRPMIGRMGVAPSELRRESNDKGDFGGGMGNPQITKGAIVYLPVFHEGALLTIGDCHAAHGEGEVTASSVECALDATLRIAIEETFKVMRPVVANQDEVMTTGEGPTMEEATRGAVHAMADLVVSRLGVDYTDAAMIISSSADVRVGLAGNPPYTMRVALRRSLLSL